MLRLVLLIFAAVFALSLGTLNYFNHYYAEKAMQSDAEQLLYQFHDALFEAHQILASLPDPVEFQCTDETRELLAKHSFENPAIRLLGVIHGNEQHCVSEAIHLDMSHYHQRIMDDGGHEVSDKFFMASAAHGDKHSDLLMVRTHNDSRYFVSLDPFMVNHLVEFACVDCLAYDFVIDGEPELFFHGQDISGESHIEYRSTRQEGILDVNLHLRGTKAFYNYYKELSWVSTIVFALIASSIIALLAYHLLTIRQSMDRVMHDALKFSEFVPFYQPIVDSRNGELVGAEVLVRWQHRDGSIVPPYQFIPFAEDSGLIIEITEQLIDKVVKDLKLFGWDKTRQFASVNLVPEHLKSSRLYDYLTSCCEQSALPPENISLEITERLQIDDLRAARETLEKFYQLGISLKLDDAGTGYGGFSYIQELGISTLKIDKMFVDTINSNDVKHSVLGSIISFAKSSDLGTIAEGVEDESQVEYLKEQGVYLIQGYVYAKPMAAKNLIVWMDKHKNENVVA